MTKKRRIEVNLEELDQIIDRSTRALLSRADSEKLKTALHAGPKHAGENIARC